jgi:lysozyme
MQVSSQGLEILKDREKLELTAYQDSGGVWTIGYGATTYENGTKVKKGDTITEAKAVQLLSYHVGIAAGSVNRLVTSTLNQGQFDALTSFVYNVGSGNFQKSNLLKVVNTDPNNYDAVEKAFLAWISVTVNGQLKPVQGLINRRNEEIEMYRSGSELVVLKKNGSLIWVAVAVLIFIIYRYAKRHNRE